MLRVPNNGHRWFQGPDPNEARKSGASVPVFRVPVEELQERVRPEMAIFLSTIQTGLRPSYKYQLRLSASNLGALPAPVLCSPAFQKLSGFGLDHLSLESISPIQNR